MQGRHWILTASGKKFSPIDPDPRDVDILDIAHALSHLCRYTGHTRKLYTVAQHCCHVSDACSPENRLWGLLHDSTEAYCNDIAKPLKISLPDYNEIEARVARAVAIHFGLPLEEPSEVKELDKRIVANEFRDLFFSLPTDFELPPSLPGLRIKPWSPRRAREQFLLRFWELSPPDYKRPSLFYRLCGRFFTEHRGAGR